VKKFSVLVTLALLAVFAPAARAAQQPPDPAGTKFSVNSSNDDTFAWCWEETTGGYPPEDSNCYGSSPSDTFVGTSKAKYPPGVGYGEAYEIDNGLLSFDTSSLLDNVTVTGATLRVHPTYVQNANSRDLAIEWHQWDEANPINSHTALWPNNALSGKSLGDFQVGIAENISLQNAGANINKTGDTELRLTVSGDVAPTGENTLNVASYDHATAPEPQLFIEYTTPRPDPFPGVRWIPTMGVYKSSGQGWASEPSLIDTQYSNYVGATHEDAYLDLDADNERYYFCGGRKYEWDAMLVNENLAPTSRTQAQNPNWSNYKWNNNDVIDEMLDDSSAVAAGKAKACIFVGTTATSSVDPVPNWLESASGRLTWTDGQGKVHIRLDKTVAHQHVADFLIAVSKRYGNDPRVASITHAEYYTNPDGGGIPADFDYDAYRTNIKTVWQEWIANTPVDANGNRVTLMQGEPIPTGGFVTAQNIRDIGIGVSGSVPHLFSGGALETLRQQLYGDVPLEHKVNANGIGDSQQWPTVSNPFGLSSGTRALRYEHVAWYYGTEGETPLDSLSMEDALTHQAQWHEAYGQFGPNGTEVAQWGQIPNYPPVP
jgi:hypothetical protein